MLEKINKKQENKITQQISYFILILIMSLVYIRGFNHFLDWDAINYIANGLSLWDEKVPLFVYPGTVFSLFTVFIAENILKSTQFSSFLILAVIPVCVTIMFSYKICRIYVDRFKSLCIVSLVFLIFDFKYGVSYMLIQAYSDGWLLMFLSMCVYFVLIEKLIAAAFFMGIAYFFRSQAIFLVLFFPLLFSNKGILRILLFFSVFITTVLIINRSLHYFFYMPNSGESKFYLSWMTNFSLYPNLNFSMFFSDIFHVVKHFRMSFNYFLFLVFIFYISKNKNKYLSKIFYYGVFLFLLQFFSLLHMRVTNILTHVSENRYFIYSLLIISLASFLSLSMSKWNTANNRKKITYLICFVILIRTSIAVFTLTRLDKRFYALDFDTRLMPKIPKNAKMSNVGVFPQGLTYYAFKNRSLINYTTCKEAIADNSSDFLFVSNKKTCLESIGMQEVWNGNHHLANFSLYSIR